MKIKNKTNIQNLEQARLVLMKTLENSLGLPTYQYLIKNLITTDVTKNLYFQTKYNGFFKVRRDAKWRKSYFQILESFKKKHPLNFQIVLSEIYIQTGEVEPSFASKLLSIIDPSQPVWDSYVLKNLNLKMKAKSREHKILESVSIFDQLFERTKTLIETDWGKETIKTFDDFFPIYKTISNVKKLDFILWKTR